MRSSPIVPTCSGRRRAHLHHAHPDLLVVVQRVRAPLGVDLHRRGRGAGTPEAGRRDAAEVVRRTASLRNRLTLVPHERRASALRVGRRTGADECPPVGLTRRGGHVEPVAVVHHAGHRANTSSVGNSHPLGIGAGQHSLTVHVLTPTGARRTLDRVDLGLSEVCGSSRADEHARGRIVVDDVDRGGTRERVVLRARRDGDDDRLEYLDNRVILGLHLEIHRACARRNRDVALESVVVEATRGGATLVVGHQEWGGRATGSGEPDHAAGLAGLGRRVVDDLDSHRRQGGLVDAHRNELLRLHTAGGRAMPAVADAGARGADLPVRVRVRDDTRPSVSCHATDGDATSDVGDDVETNHRTLTGVHRTGVRPHAEVRRKPLVPDQHHARSRRAHAVAGARQQHENGGLVVSRLKDAIIGCPHTDPDMIGVLGEDPTAGRAVAVVGGHGVVPAVVAEGRRTGHLVVDLSTLSHDPVTDDLEQTALASLVGDALGHLHVTDRRRSDRGEGDLHRAVRLAVVVGRHGVNRVRADVDVLPDELPVIGAGDTIPEAEPDVLTSVTPAVELHRGDLALGVGSASGELHVSGGDVRPLDGGDHLDERRGVTLVVHLLALLVALLAEGALRVARDEQADEHDRENGDRVCREPLGALDELEVRHSEPLCTHE